MAVKDKDRKKDDKKKDPAPLEGIPQAERYDFSYTQNRELSWLRFDDRVLAEAYDESVPLFERLKFVSIFESNLDEFFMIRIGGLSDLATLKHQPRDNKSNLTPSEQIDKVFEALPPLYARQARAFHELEEELVDRGMVRLEPSTLIGDERTFVEGYFKSFISPIISPLVIDPRHPFPNLRNGGLYLVCSLAASADESGLLGLIEVPASLPRVIEIPSTTGEYRYILLEDVIMSCIDGCFGSYEPQDRAVIRVIRNADIDPDGEGVEEEEDYRQHMKKVLKLRQRLQPVRLEIRGKLGKTLEGLIADELSLEPRRIFHLNRPIDLGYVYGLESHIPDHEHAACVYRRFEPQISPMVDLSLPMRGQVEDHDVLLTYPYESMTPLLRLVREASADDACISIKITLYRVAKSSHLCESLISAAEAGKDVTVLMELRARFDEANNIAWAERLEDAGCTVIYGSEGFKCHSKICQITYREGMAVTRITLLGTGNFNEKTAKLYSDFMLMTAHPGIGEDANSFFQNLSLGNLRGSYRYLGVAPAGLKPLIMTGLNREIDRAQAGLPARVFFKLNSLTDREVIDKISEASRAGVQVEMIIRGISCLLPGVAGKTENVHIRSIVGRYLEHARVYAFGEDADTVYLSSADMMTRNTEHRVEIAFPVLDAGVRAQVIQYMDIQLKDNVKARELTPKGLWAPIVRAVGDEPFIAQEHLMTLAIERASSAEKAASRRAAARPTVPMGTPPAAAVEADHELVLEGAGHPDGMPVEPAPIVEPQVAPAPQPEPAAQPASVAGPQSAPAPQPAPATEPEPVAQPSAAPEPAPQAAPAQQPAAEAQPAPEPAPAPEPVETPQPATTPEPAFEPEPEPEPAQPRATSVKATIIDPQEDANEVDEDLDEKDGGTKTIVIRRIGRVATGFALIGMGFKTLLFGSKQEHEREAERLQRIQQRQQDQMLKAQRIENKQRKQALRQQKQQQKQRQQMLDQQKKALKQQKKELKQKKRDMR